MKMKFFTILSILLLLSCQQNNNLVVFTPVTIENESLEPDFYDNLQVVLKNYNVRHEVKGGKVYVSKELYNDTELMMNYTIKARDKEWLKERKD